MLSLSEVRRELHQLAEISGQESGTRAFLKAELLALKPSRLLELQNCYGLIAEFDSGISGPGVAIRVDTDALPIFESESLGHASKTPGVSHKCGHDGHSSVGLGLARKLKEASGWRGKLFLIFQPEEETGEGALKVLNDPSFPLDEIDHIYGFHNVPGEDFGSVILRSPVFACASVGMKISLKGRSSHAAEPEKAISPLNTLFELTRAMSELESRSFNRDFFQATLVSLKMGNEDFGISPGEASLCFTLRAQLQSRLEQKKSEFEKILSDRTQRAGLKFELQYLEQFPSLEVSAKETEIVKQSAQALSLAIERFDQPFRWSEDFGHFTELIPGTYFGFGVGKNCAPLHDPNYDFPDEALEKITELFLKILEGSQALA